MQERISGEILLECDDKILEVGTITHVVGAKFSGHMVSLYRLFGGMILVAV